MRRTIIWRFRALNPIFLPGARCVSRRLRLRPRLGGRGFVFRPNGVRLSPSRIAYNLGNLWRRLVLPTRIDNWPLTSLEQRSVKTGGRLVKRAR